MINNILYRQNLCTVNTYYYIKLLGSNIHWFQAFCWYQNMHFPLIQHQNKKNSDCLYLIPNEEFAQNWLNIGVNNPWWNMKISYSSQTQIINKNKISTIVIKSTTLTLINFHTQIREAQRCQTHHPWEQHQGKVLISCQNIL